MKFYDRALRAVGLQRRSAEAAGYRGGMHSRLTLDWALGGMSNDQKLRGGLEEMRRRSRDLVENNEYGARFINKAKENVIGSNGVGLQMTFTEDDLGSSATKVNKAIELAWQRWCDKVSACGQMSMVDFAQLWVATFLMDGEAFVNRMKGYEFNDSRFALQFVDADQIDVKYSRLSRRAADGTVVENEIKLGVELDQYRRPVAYWAYDVHPAEMAGVRRLRLDAERVSHSYVFKVLNQTRGIPVFHAVMLALQHLGKYEEAEIVGARLAACKMAAFVSKLGPEDTVTQRDKNSGAIEMTAAPAEMFHLPEGMDVHPIDWNHPNQNFPEFTKAMLRGVAAGLNTAYSTMTGDLRDVNFSSIRSGILDEREGWRSLQTFAVGHCYRPVFADWLGMALLTGQVQLPSSLPVSRVLEAARWTPRGWDWVDPVKDVTADIMALRAGMTTHSAIAQKRGRDFFEDIEQRKREIEHAKKNGVEIDLSDNGTAAAVIASENGNAPGGGNKPNGKGALAAYGENHLVRLEQ
jgi:lambda family phage portal protein